MVEIFKFRYKGYRWLTFGIRLDILSSGIRLVMVRFRNKGKRWLTLGIRLEILSSGIRLGMV